MRLSWKDIVATALVAAVVGLYAALLTGVDAPLAGGVRTTALGVLVLGLAACGFGGGDSAAQPGPRDLFTGVGGSLATWLGAFAGVVAVSTLAFGGPALLAILVGAVATLWLIATVRHAAGSLRRRRIAGRTPMAGAGR
jgi:hypothetical protein